MGTGLQKSLSVSDETAGLAFYRKLGAFSSFLFLPASDFPFEGSSRTRELKLWSMQSPEALSLTLG